MIGAVNGSQVPGFCILGGLQVEFLELSDSSWSGL